MANLGYYIGIVIDENANGLCLIRIVKRIRELFESERKRFFLHVVVDVKRILDEFLEDQIVRKEDNRYLNV